MRIWARSSETWCRCARPGRRNATGVVLHLAGSISRCDVGFSFFQRVESIEPVAADVVGRLVLLEDVCLLAGFDQIISAAAPIQPRIAQPGADPSPVNIPAFPRFDIAGTDGAIARRSGFMAECDLQFQ